MNEGILEDMLGKLGLTTAGRGEWRGMCPSCGGSTASTKFVYTRDAGADGRGLYHCHSCGAAGTTLHLYAATMGGARGWTAPEPADFRAAAKALGLEGGHHHHGDEDLPRLEPRHEWTPAPERTPPPADWQERRKRALRIWCGHILRRRPSPACLAALRKRHLTLDEARELARAGMLGWTGEALACAAWRGNELVCIRIRKPDGWQILPGGQNIPVVLGMEPGKPAVVVEAYIDAMVGWMHHGDTAAFIGLGSVTVTPRAELADALRNAPRVLVSLDADAAGDRRWPWWRDRFQNAGRLRPVRDAKGFGDIEPRRAADVLAAALAVDLDSIRHWRPRVKPAQYPSRQPAQGEALEAPHEDGHGHAHEHAHGHEQDGNVAETGTDAPSALRPGAPVDANPERVAHHHAAPAGTLPRLLQWADNLLARRNAVRDARGATHAQPVWRIHLPAVYAGLPGYHSVVNADDAYEAALSNGWMLSRSESTYHLSIVLHALWERTGATATRDGDIVRIRPARDHRWGVDRDAFRDAPPLPIPERVDLEAAHAALAELMATAAARPDEIWRRFPLRCLMPAGLRVAFPEDVTC